MAFLAGINDGPIYRLKYTLAAIPESKVKLLEELQTLMNAESNYENYRQVLAMVPTSQPCIPYLYVLYVYGCSKLIIFAQGGLSA